MLFLLKILSMERSSDNQNKKKKRSDFGLHQFQFWNMCKFRSSFCVNFLNSEVLGLYIYDVHSEGGVELLKFVTYLPISFQLLKKYEKSPLQIIQIDLFSFEIHILIEIYVLCIF